MIKFHCHLSTCTGKAQKRHVPGSALPYVVMGVMDRLIFWLCQPSLFVSLEIQRSFGRRRDLSKDPLSEGVEWAGVDWVEVQQPHRGGWEKLRQLNLGQPETLQAAVSSPASQGDGCLQGTFVAQGASRTHSAVGYHGVGTNGAELLAWSWECAGWHAAYKVNKNPMTEQYFKDRNYAKSVWHVKQIWSVPAQLHFFTCKDENTT